VRPTGRACCAALAVALATTPVRAEDEGGLFARGALALSRVNRAPAAILGLELGYQTRTGWLFGAALYDLLNGMPLVDQPPSAAQTLRTKLHYYGVLLGRDVALGRCALGGLLFLGAGDASAYAGEKKNDQDRSWFLVAEPALVFRLPDLAHFRTQLAAGYRVPVRVHDGGTATRDLHGPTLSLRVGIAEL
jgi:hypothetical protein